MNEQTTASAVAQLRALADVIEDGELLDANIVVERSHLEGARDNERSVNIRARYVGRQPHGEYAP